ncbi:MAG: DUF885 family protein [Elusimicrobiaceae bacterium]|nr:DUF885 family protein [Elusimicrobiaceae bacterium]
MKKLLCTLLSISLLSAPAAQAIDLGDFDNIDAIMEDNALTDTANRYGSIQLSFFPEFATRLGFESANNKLDQRDPERDAQALRAYNIVEESFSEVERKNLSESKKTEYDILQGRLAYDHWNLNRNRASLDPLHYAEVFDAIYDLRLKQLNYQDLQDRDLTARVNALVSTAEQAQRNLANPPSFLAQIAMEKAYYAYLSFDDVAQYMLSRAQDDVSRNQVRADARAAKKAIKDMFELFKRLAQENQEQDFRLGERNYNFTLNNLYFINAKSRTLEKMLDKNFLTAQQNLANALEAFSLPTDLEEETLLADIHVPGEEMSEEQGVTVSSIEAENLEEQAAITEGTEEEQAPKPAKKEKKKKKNKNEPLVKASAFYNISSRLTEGVKNQNFVAALNKESSNLIKFFIQDDSLPVSGIKFYVKQMPAYYAYMQPYRFMAPFGTQGNPVYDFFLRVPSGNENTRQEMLNRDFNLPTLKLLMAGQLVPGLAYHATYSTPNLSSFRKMYPVPTMQNGWEVYAQHLASERGYIITDEELLFLAWADYVRAAQALVDYNLHTEKFTYGQALAWLTEKHGFDKTQAEGMLKQVASKPAEAVSYIYGYEALKNLRTKYQKKQGKKFSLGDFNSKVMEMGYIPTDRLEAEMENAYKAEKSKLTQALSTPFYMD